MPIKRTTILGPYLSEAQPTRTTNIIPSTIEADATAEVAARVRLNSLSMDLKKKPKENLMKLNRRPLKLFYHRNLLRVAQNS